MTPDPKWLEDAARSGWTMPVAPAWKRLPLVRHIRAAWGKWQVERWYAAGPGMFGLRSGYDDWVLYGIWHGLERPTGGPHEG